MRKFSLAQASVKWKFVTDVPDSLDYFGHHKGFVFMRDDSNLFIMQLIMCEIKSSQHHVFMLLCGTQYKKIHWKLSHNQHLPITHSGAHVMQNQQITCG